MTDTEFKKVRLFKVAKELNITVDTVTDYLEANGFKHALAGAGINASITDEDAYLGLLEEYADDKEIASRIRRKRAERVEAEGEAAQAEPALPTPPAAHVAAPVVSPVVAPVVETPVELPVEVVAPESPVAEPEPVATEVALPQPEPETEQAVADEPETVEIVPEPAAEHVLTLDETEDVEGSEVAEVAPSEVEAEPKPAVQEVEPVDETPPQVVESEPEADLEVSPADVIPAEVLSDLMTADRYKLAGTKVLGKLDLTRVESDDSASAAAKKKRKRIEKGGPDAPPTTTTTTPTTEADRAKAAKKAKKKGRGPAVDEADVAKTLHDTLREMEQGASRTRQKRRRARRDERAAERDRDTERAHDDERVLRVTEFLSTGELANLMGKAVTEVISTLFKSGMMVSINQRLDADTITFVADEFGFSVEFITEFTVDDLEIEEDDPADLRDRAPVVTVMGHVDHGKTSLLDHVRRTNVVAGEAGGITQHIGAYNVVLPNGREVTFLDTPGHEAFTAMRARGAQVTDLVILVVAADDAVMPQTIEAINHAKAADVPIVVAINKIDKPEVNIPRVMQQLADHGVLVEQYGGKAQCAQVSAKSGVGLEDLMEKVLLEADLLDLEANPDRNAVAVVIESRLEKGRGNVATVLVQNGTLKVGDIFITGVYSGRVRAMFDERDKRVKEVGPSKPALVTGLDGAPDVGDTFIVVDDEREAREIAQKRQQIMREQSLRQRKHITLDEIGRRLALGDFRELNLIVKADVGGSVEAVADSLMKLSTEEVAVNIVHKGVGAINDSDVMLASASDAIIIGFQVRPVPGARQLAEQEEIDIRLYSVIYNAIEEVRDALEGLLSPEKSESILGVAEVRETFKVPKVGTIAGCLVIEGRIKRHDRIHLIRDGVVIYAGTLASLKRFKDDAREVVSGYECGMGIENFNDIKVGDQIEAYEIVEKKRKLDG